MKLSALFSKYLYQHKTLALPGIGIFTIDPTIPVPEPTDKNYAELAHSVKFVQTTVVKPDESLIDFIRTNTGKIRPLAESDLESFLSDGKILLNIGRPFYFEGMGSLQKNRQGYYDFFPGAPLIDKLEVNRDQQLTEFQETTPNFPQQSNNLRRVLMVVAILVGLLAVIMGGYYMYNRNQSAEVPQGQALQDSTTLAQDSLATLPDNTRTTLTTLPPDTTLASGFRYVVQTIYGKEQGFTRFNEMKRSNPSVQMISNADSSQFRLFLVVPTPAGDTTRTKDSLQRIYSNNKVEILY
ncbi:MAG TPA: hypothetical protein VLC28_09605 [Flavitalea sp.]|nr:hypothetical protein [Flavitalea sp.]